TALQAGDSLKAQSAFTALEKAPEDIRAAEALFFKATLQAQQGQYEAANTTIASISQNHNNSEVWGAKSLLLMAQNFQALDDPFQAQFILDTLIENFDRYPEVQADAVELKAQLNNPTSADEN
ncbi:MAG: tetratricopeptide repeat protein, partial [Flavobacteriaceae bacterium]